MPKESHVHIVTDIQHKEILENLGKKFGSMTKAFENAIDIINQNKNLTACSECEIRVRSDQDNSFRELFNMVAFSADNIRELLKYLQGDVPLSEYLQKSRDKAFQFGKQYFGILKKYPENNYEKLLSMIEDWKRATRLLGAIQIDSFTNTIIARVNVFESVPILVAIGLIGYLEALHFTFDIDILESDIVIRWLNPEKDMPLLLKVEDKIRSYIQDATQKLKPYLIKQGFLFVTPDFLDWVSENLFPSKLLPIDISLNFLQAAIGKLQPEPRPLEVAKICKDLLMQINFVDQIDIKVNDEKQIFKLIISCKTPNLPKVVLQGILIGCSKMGWKLQKYRITQKVLDATFQYVGDKDPTILEPLYFNNFMAYLNQNFQKLRIIPVDEYEDFTSTLYYLQPDKFQEVFRKQGTKLANALKLLCKNDLAKMRQVALFAIPQFFQQTERDPNGINIIAELNKTTMIFKTTNLIEAETFKAMICGLLEEFGYKNIESKIIENVLTIEYTRPSNIEASTITVHQ